MSVTSCDYCNSDHANLKCSKCKCVYYCSQTCQKKDWKEHRKKCEWSAHEALHFHAKETEMMAYLSVLADAANRECAICLDKIRENPLALPCKHVFCEICIVEHEMCLEHESLSCPSCSKELPEGLFAYIFDNACFFILMADRNPDKREYFYAQARREMNVLANNDFENFCTRNKNAELLCLEGKYKEAISASQAIMKVEHDPTDTLQLRNIISAYMGLQEYHAAMKYLHKMQMIFDHVPLPDCSREMYFVYYRGSECMYHLGLYRESIQSGQAALYLNRTREEVHKWVALSYKALGQWDEAVLTMRRAVRYEAPWDPRYAQRCQELLDQLLLEQQEQLQK